METRDLPAAGVLTALSATVALAFGRVFDGGRWVVPLLLAAVLPCAAGFVVRSRARGHRTAIAMISAVAAAGIVVIEALVVLGASPSTIGNRVSAGWHIIESRSVPLPATNATLALAVLVVGAAAIWANHLAFHREASLAAMAPGIALLIWLTALGHGDGEWLDLAAFGVAAVVFVVVQHQALLGSHRTRLGSHGRLDAPRLVGVGLVTGIGAVAIGMLIAPILPGGQHPIFDSSVGPPVTGSTYKTSVPPLLDVGDQLRRGDRQELFTVRASAPDYWRIVALDQYRSDGGGQWSLTAQGNDAVGQGLDGAAPPGALVQEYHIGTLSERWMPAAYRPVRVSLSNTLVVRASSTLVTSAASVTGLRYTVSSDAPALVLTAAQRARAAANAPTSMTAETVVPADLPDIVRSTAARITAGLTSAVDKAQALRDFFRDGSFVYDPSVNLGDSQAAVAQFLTTRRGFCVQFATAYALMARVVGIPARVAVGFTPGTKDASGLYHVTTWDAHAWPEVWLAGLGWTHLFDPTPPAERGGSDLPTEPPVAQRSPTSTPTTAPGTTATTNAPATTPTSAPATPGSTPATNPNANVTIQRSSTSTDDTTTWILLMGLALVLLAASPVVVVLTLKRQRRARRRNVTDPTRSIEGAWREIVDALSDRRLSWPRSDTPLELARRVPAEAGAAAAAPMRALAESYSAVRYGAAVATSADAATAWRNSDSLRRTLDASITLRARLRARLDPTTLRHQPEPAGWSRRRSSSTKL